MSKKAQVGSGLTDIFMFLSIVTIAFIFFIILNFKGCGSNDITFQNKGLLNSRANTMILSYLRSPVDNETMEDVLIEYFVLQNKTLKSKIEERTKSFLNRMPSCAYISIEREGLFLNRTLMKAYSVNCDPKNYVYLFWCSPTYLPSFDKNEKIVARACVVYSFVEAATGFSKDNLNAFGSDANWLISQDIALPRNYVFVSDKG